MRVLLGLLVLASAVRLGERLAQIQYGRTAQGSMAYGLEGVGEDLTQLRREINADDRDVDRIVNSQFDLTAPALTGTVEIALATRQQELQTLQARIDYINSVLDTAIATCPNYPSCTSCTQQASCIWCRSTMSCIAGDSSGGVGDYCEVFEHGECSLGCEQHIVCSACVTQGCAWCQSSQSCIAEDQADSCEAGNLVRSRENEGCGGQDFTGNGSYQVRSTVQAVDISALRRELREDESRISGIQRDIASLQDEDNRIADGFRNITSLQLDPISVSNPMTGLGAIVDSTAQTQGNFPTRPRNPPANENFWARSSCRGQQFYH